MAILRWKGSSQARRNRRRRAAASALLRPSEFDHAAACERMRVDRNHSPLSILLITLAEDASRPEDVNYLARLMADRLRMTDTAGRLRDGRVAVLLPDTAEPGAWKVAADLCEHYEPGRQRPGCEVMVYPDHPPTAGHAQGTEASEVGGDMGGDIGGDGDSGGAGDLDGNRGSGVGSGVDMASECDGPAVGASAPALPPPTLPAPTLSASSQEIESFFAKSPPSWKRAFDIVGAAFGLAVAAPVIGVAAAAVSLTSRGGPFYAQVREGHGGRRFKIYKIRTMRQNADQLKDQLRVHSEQDGPAFKMTSDPRVTRIGAFLRKTSIDELPQLYNVLRGEMSLVGPRPLQIDESLACEPWQRQRLVIKPGLTCIWQVKGRSVVSFEDWIRMDLDYARRNNLRMDLGLLMQTPPALLLSKGPR